MREEAGLFYWEMEMRIDGQIRDNPPCKDCTDRHTACHGSCDRYKEWKLRLDEVNKRRKEYNERPFVKYNPYDY